MTVAASWVAVVAGPMAVVAWLFQRRLAAPVRTIWKSAAVNGNGVDMALLFLGLSVMPAVMMGVLDAVGFFRAVYGPPPDIPEGVAAIGGTASRAAVVASSDPTGGLRYVWSALLATPIVLLAWAWVRITLDTRLPHVSWRSMSGHVAVGAVAWPIVHGAVFAVYIVTLLVMAAGGDVPDNHPLVNVRLEMAGAATILLFGSLVCFVAPFTEELLFRGLTIEWAASRSYRPLILAAVAVVLAALTSANLTAVAFAVVLAIGLAVVRLVPRRVAGIRVRPRMLAAIWASSAVFAAVHSAVWPTPIPLFVLGLGLGWLRVWTGGITTCVVVHSLFNAVSFVYLLRGGGP